MKKDKNLVIYKDKQGRVKLDLVMDKSSLWLTQAQIAEIFGVNRPAITKHIGNIFKTQELQEKSVCSILELTASDKKTYKTKCYNLDMVISVGYRINSSDATKFRIWATDLLKQHLIQGYTINQKRLDELQKTIKLISSANDLKNIDEARGIIEVINQYNQSFSLLSKFDSSDIKNSGLNDNITYKVEYDESIEAISILKKRLIFKKEAGKIFGNQKDRGLESILGAITQTFDNKYLYKSIEEQAANLLYLIIKDHPFSDGNKRIGAFMFIWFLQKNKHNIKKSGEVKINDNALVALALLVASSNPKEKDLMVSLIISLIKG